MDYSIIPTYDFRLMSLGMSTRHVLVAIGVCMCRTCCYAYAHTHTHIRTHAGADEQRKDDVDDCSLLQHQRANDHSLLQNHESNDY